MTTNQQVTILLAEDNAGHARLIEKNLHRANIANKIIKFENGQELLDFLFKSGGCKNDHSAEDHALLVLLDLRLPIMSGYQVLTRMKKDKRTRHIPVIILTTTENPQEISKCYALGCNVYITKPLEYDEFCEAIRKLGFFLTIVRIPEKSSDNHS